MLSISGDAVVPTDSGRFWLATLGTAQSRYLDRDGEPLAEFAFPSASPPMGGSFMTGFSGPAVAGERVEEIGSGLHEFATQSRYSAELSQEFDEKLPTGAEVVRYPLPYPALVAATALGEDLVAVIHGETDVTVARLTPEGDTSELTRLSEYEPPRGCWESSDWRCSYLQLAAVGGAVLLGPPWLMLELAPRPTEQGAQTHK